jgi:hypothetical protein
MLSLWGALSDERSGLSPLSLGSLTTVRKWDWQHVLKYTYQFGQMDYIMDVIENKKEYL